MNLIYVFFVEGPCLLHSTNGELLRSLHSPSGSLHPQLVRISNDCYVIVNYAPSDKSHLATFTLNGKHLKEVGIDDELYVSIFRITISRIVSITDNRVLVSKVLRLVSRTFNLLVSAMHSDSAFKRKDNQKHV